MKTHEIKIEPHYYQSVINGSKTCEIRKDDRDYQVNDKIIFKLLTDEKTVRGFDEEYDGDWLIMNRNVFVITHVLRGGQLGLYQNWVALSIKKY